MEKASRAAVLSGLIVFLAAAPALSAAIPTFGEGLDPSGDSTTPGKHDIVRSFASSDGTDITFGVRYAPGTYVSPTAGFTGATFAQITVNTDQDVTTGDPFFGLGIEFLLEVPRNRGVQSLAGELYQYGAGSYTLVSSSLGTTYYPDGFDVVVPLALLGNDDGLLDFWAQSQEILGLGTWTGILDSVPDFGPDPTGALRAEAVSTHPVPEPTSMLLLGTGLLGLARRRRKAGG